MAAILAALEPRDALGDRLPVLPPGAGPRGVGGVVDLQDGGREVDKVERSHVFPKCSLEIENLRVRVLSGEIRRKGDGGVLND